MEQYVGLDVSLKETSLCVYQTGTTLAVADTILWPAVSTKYKCHRLCHLQMSLGSGAEPLRSAAPDRRPMRRSRKPPWLFYRAS